MRYLVILEKTETGFGAYVPDLPGCVAAAKSEAEVRDLIRKAVELHLEALREAGEPIPTPTTSSTLVEAGAA